MGGVIELKNLLKEMRPYLSDIEYVFCTIKHSNLNSIDNLEPICTFREEEGLTVVLEKKRALTADLKFSEVFNKITLQVHSSLAAVGLTAAVSKVLAEKGISANVVAAYYHDHIFVPSDKAGLAMKALKSLSEEV